MDNYDAWYVSRRFQEGTHGTARLKFYTADAFTALRASIHGGDIKKGDKVLQLFVNGNLWMSDSRDELRDHYTAIRMATGRVLIHGLGLGCYLSSVCANPEVTHVDVVELNPDVIALVAPYFKDDPRVSIVQGDAFTYQWPKGSRWNCVWHDIWSGKCTDDLTEHSKLLRSFGKHSDWQGCWAHEYLLYKKRQGQ
jgi:predicted membrane-bound spermidine synthase